MVSPKEESLVYGIKQSSVGPARSSGPDLIYEPSNMDLAMKLHYLRGVYFFRCQTVQGLTVVKTKETMFTWLNNYYTTCGRFRRSETTGRPYIKLNDCGSRFIEAKCDKTLDEWLDMDKDCSLHKLLVSNQVLGPELVYSPPVLVQFTWFKCGGMSLGLSWAHVLGDAFSIADYINTWSRVLAGYEPEPIPRISRPLEKGKFKNPTSHFEEPLSIKRVDPVGDHWTTPNNCQMSTFSFQITAKQLSHLQAQNNSDHQVPAFEFLCAIIWKSMARIRQGSEPKVVTLCKKGSGERGENVVSNSQNICVVKADLLINEASPTALAALLVDQAVDERNQIEEAMERSDGLSDFILYGANLTFVDLEEEDFYGLEIKGDKPIFLNYTIDGVGENGAVLVLPGQPKNSGEDGSGGKLVTVVLPQSQVLELKSELKSEWGIA